MHQALLLLSRAAGKEPYFRAGNTEQCLLARTSMELAVIMKLSALAPLITINATLRPASSEGLKQAKQGLLLHRPKRAAYLVDMTEFLSADAKGRWASQLQARVVSGRLPVSRHTQQPLRDLQLHWEGPPCGFDQLSKSRKWQSWLIGRLGGVHLGVIC